jgi:hypothetical protein
MGFPQLPRIPAARPFARTRIRAKIETVMAYKNSDFKRLALQFTESGACAEEPTVRLALACGRIRNDVDRIAIRAHFEARGSELWDEPWLRKHLQRMAEQGYENQVSAVVAKLLLRGKLE